MKTNTKSVLSRSALLFSAILAGAAFVVIKDSLDNIGPGYINTIKNCVSFVILAAIFARRLKNIDWVYIKSGLIIGLFRFTGAILQTIGLIGTTPGKSPFLTSIYCVAVPFICWAVYRNKPDKFNFLAAALCILGIGLISITNAFTIEPGDTLTILSGLFFAMQFIAVSRSTQRLDPVLLTVIQFGFTGLLSLAYSLLFEAPPTHFDGDMLLSMAYIAVFATALAILLQMVGLKSTPVSTGSIILSLESVFSVLFSVIFFGETLTPRLVIGFAAIFIAIIVSETKLSFITQKREKSM